MTHPLSSPARIDHLDDLRQLQRLMSAALFRPLAARDRMQSIWEDGRMTEEVVAGFIKPNDRLTALERLEIYNRQYWFRLLDCLYDDYPGLRSLLGWRRFHRLCKAYLTRYPSRSWTLRNLGRQLPQFIEEAPEFTTPRTVLALDMVRFEWAQVLAFDEAHLPPLRVDDLLGSDPSQLCLGLQSHLSLLELSSGVDEYFMAVRKENEERQHGTASQAHGSAPQRRSASRLPQPKLQSLQLVVYRYDAQIYFKRIEREAYLILRALRDGLPVSQALETALTEADASADWTAKIQSWFETWAALGWFCQTPTKPLSS